MLIEQSSYWWLIWEPMTLMWRYCYVSGDSKYCLLGSERVTKLIKIKKILCINIWDSKHQANGMFYPRSQRIVGLKCGGINILSVKFRDTVECRYNAVQYNVIFHTEFQWPWHYLDHSCHSQKTPMGCLLWKFFGKIHPVITAPHCMYISNANRRMIHFSCLLSRRIWSLQSFLVTSGIIFIKVLSKSIHHSCCIQSAITKSLKHLGKS